MSNGIYGSLWERNGRSFLLEYTLICGGTWGHDRECGGGGGGSGDDGLLLGSEGRKGTIHLLLRLQWMPLGDGAPGVGQHVGPVLQPGSCGLASYPDLPNGVVFANLVIIQHSDHGLDFLGEQRGGIHAFGVKHRAAAHWFDRIISHWV